MIQKVLKQLHLLHHESWFLHYDSLNALQALPSGLQKKQSYLVLLIEFSMYHTFLRLFMISFKYDLVSSRYSLTDRVLFLSPLLLCSRQLLPQKLYTVTGLHLSSSSCSKRFLLRVALFTLFWFFSIFLFYNNSWMHFFWKDSKFCLHL